MSNTALQIKEFVPHVIADMTNEQYHSHSAISKSSLDLIRRSPLHYYIEKIGTDEDLKRKQTKAMNVGTAFHLLALEPDKFDAHVAVSPELNKATKEGKATWAAFEAANQGKILLRPDDMEDLREMAKMIQAHPAAKFLLQGKGMVEASIFWRDDIYNADCRARPDWMRDDGLLIDIKTCEDASPAQFDRHFWNYRYHVQAAFYLDGYKAVYGKESPGFVFIVVEKKPPYAVSVRMITPEYTEIGRRAYLENLETYAKCLETGIFPGYGNEVIEIHPPAWANNL